MTFKCVANGVYKLHAGTQGWQELRGFTAVELGRVFNPRVLTHLRHKLHDLYHFWNTQMSISTINHHHNCPSTSAKSVRVSSWSSILIKVYFAQEGDYELVKLDLRRGSDISSLSTSTTLSSKSWYHWNTAWLGLTEMNFKSSSMTRTGALIYNTAFHSSALRGAIANNFYIKKSACRPHRESSTGGQLTVKKGT